jgi:prevent-host-death family protein
MRTVTHREMRNNSGEILRAVAAGETIRVTNNGRVAALIVPPPEDPLDDLVARGQARPALLPLGGFGSIRRQKSDLSTAEILDDLRGEW